MKIKPQPVSIKGFGTCIHRAFQSEKLGFDTQFGMLFLYDKKLGTYDPIYPNHVWSCDDNENIHDDLNAIYQDAIAAQFVCNPLEKWKVSVIDGTNLPYGEYNTRVISLGDRFAKIYKADLLYVVGYAYQNDKRTPFTWDTLDELFDELAEKVY